MATIRATAEAAEAMADTSRTLTCRIVDGADHLYTGRAAELVEVIAEWLAIGATEPVA